jgi:hypothetical protein
MLWSWISALPNDFALICRICSSISRHVKSCNVMCLCDSINEAASQLSSRNLTWHA